MIRWAFLLALTLPSSALAQSILIRNATVHTAAAAGTLKESDVLVQGGRIAAIGTKLTAPEGVRSIDARGKPLSPGLFGGFSHIGVYEIGLEPTASDESITLGMRPEFDLTLAFNDESVTVTNTRNDGVTYVMLAPVPGAASGGGSLLAGQGALQRLDGRAAAESAATRAMFIEMGADAVGYAGGSRAAQFMLLRQALTEARTPTALLTHDERLLTPTGRQVLSEWLKSRQLFVIDVDRAADIRQVLAFAQRENLRIAIRHGNEAWRVAGELKAAGVAVILDPFENLPGGFDEIGTTMENAARLARAGVPVAFSLSDAGPDRARVLRQAAGNAVARGLPWEAALAAITRVPAEIFGGANRFGSIEVGKQADLVLWSGDPLEVSSVAEQVYIDGRSLDLRSRHTELRDRYIERLKPSFR
jgi:hypothetical protein